VADAVKDLEWVGSSLEDLRAFPADARAVAGHQLWQVQNGSMPDEFKPMPAIGPGAYEIIIDTGDAFRVFFVAKFGEAIYVLHAFQKKTKKTSHHDIARGEQLYRDVVKERQRRRGGGKTK